MIGRVGRPASLEELWPMLDDGLRPMAGGTDLLVPGRERPRRGVALLETIPGLDGVEMAAEGLRLGALARLAALERHAVIRERWPVLAQALACLGSPLIRNMGTLCGNLASASPAGDTLPALLVLDAVVELASRDGRRSLPLAEFLLGPGRTALAPGEIVAAVLIPLPPPGAVQHFEKVGRRDALAIAVASLAALVVRDATGRVAEARLAMGSLAPTALRCPAAEAALRGRRLNREALLEAGRRLREEISPKGDLRATAAYRREVAGRLPLRLLTLE